MPGGLTGAISCGIFPLLLLSLAMVESNHETVLGMNGLLFGVLIILAGFFRLGLFFTPAIPYRPVRKSWAVLLCG